MKKLTKRNVLCLAIIMLLGGLSGCCSLWWRPGCPPKIITQPQSQTIKKGTPVTFFVGVSHATTVFYQWRFNGSNIASATSNSYTIASVDFSDIGEYTVQVWGSPTNQSEVAYLSVYSTLGTDTGGTLGSPIGLFAGPNYTCSSGGTFQKGYTPVNPDGTPALFYSPTVPVTAQSGLFSPNPGLHYLRIDTFHADNGTADTGLRLKNNWSPPVILTCNDDFTGGTGTKQSRIDWTLSTANGQTTYRAGIFYKNTPGPPASGKVYINWLYHD
jgi:hypothetical protein